MVCRASLEANYFGFSLVASAPTACELTAGGFDNHRDFHADVAIPA